MDPENEAMGRYEDAIARRQAILDLWQEEGMPLLGTGSQGQDVEHPLMKMLREHDVLVQKLFVDIRKQHRGPKPSAVIQLSPAAKKRQARQQ